MKTIWKKQLEIFAEQIIQVPIGSKFLSVHMQQGNPTIWFEIPNKDYNIVLAPRKIGCVMTGDPMPWLEAYYISTVVVDDVTNIELPSFVMHFYEVVD